MELLREYPRFSVRYRVRMVGEKVEAEGEIYNLSLSGCAVESEELMQEGDYLALYISLPDHETPINIDLAGVRWAIRRELGIQFVSLSNDDRTRLRRHLSRLHQALSDMVCG